MFDTEGRRVTNLDQIMDGGIYICSSSKRFLPGNYGSYGEKTEFRAPDFQINENMADLRSPSPIRGGTTNLFSRKNTVNSAPLSSESPSDFRGSMLRNSFRILANFGETLKNDTYFVWKIVLKCCFQSLLSLAGRKKRIKNVYSRFLHRKIALQFSIAVASCLAGNSLFVNCLRYDLG